MQKKAIKNFQIRTTCKKRQEEVFISKKSHTEFLITQLILEAPFFIEAMVKLGELLIPVTVRTPRSQNVLQCFLDAPFFPFSPFTVLYQFRFVFSQCIKFLISRFDTFLSKIYHKIPKMLPRKFQKFQKKNKTSPLIYYKLAEKHLGKIIE